MRVLATVLIVAVMVMSSAFAWSQEQKQQEQKQEVPTLQLVPKSKRPPIIINVPPVPPDKRTGINLVKPSKHDPTILVESRYATKNNFTGKKIYDSGQCYIRKEVSEALMEAQKELQEEGLGLKLWDCYRPFYFQEYLWSLRPDERYVAKPLKRNGRMVEGSPHNRGSAVSLTLVDKNGKELEMPSEFDDQTEKARRDYEGSSPVAKANLMRLEKALVKQGFQPVPERWWDFNGPGWDTYIFLNIELPPDETAEK